MPITSIPIIAREVYKGFSPAVNFLNAISTKYEKGEALGTGKVLVPVVKRGATKTYSQEKGYEFDNADVSSVVVEFSAPIYVPTSWPSLEHSETGFLTESLRTKLQMDGDALGNAVFADIEAKWNAVENNTVATLTESAIDTEDIADLRQKAIEKSGSVLGWSIILSTPAYTQLLKDSKIVSEAGGDFARLNGEINRLFGINIYGAPVSIANAGYLVHTSSTAFGSQIVSPAIPEAATKAEIRRILTDVNGNGINLLNKIWHDSNHNTAREVLECWCGSKVIDSDSVLKIAKA